MCYFLLFRRIEKVRINRRDGIAKVLGTICCVAGASVITLYNGPVIYSPAPHLNRPAPMFVSLGDARGKNWTLGCIYLIGHCLSWSGWLVLQAPVLKKYPARLSVTSYTCFFGLIQFLIIAAFMERDPQAWIFHSGGELFTILYAVSIYLTRIPLWDNSVSCSDKLINFLNRTLWYTQHEISQFN